ncbi:MAG: ParB/RepB/Spo0J family partition protein [Verrucomicrobia bacterium]|nr:ParB/RepB/Spo0J family partition protein [Cytophagales bacterium]
MENKVDNTKSTKKRNALGRGLGALLQDSELVQHEDLKYEVANSINEIEMDFIEVNPYQPRTHFDQDALNELAESIRVQGIIQPITVRQLARDQYQLISGERRLQASKIAGLRTIPAFIRTANDQQMLELALIENIQRENLNSIEIALSYQRLISECNLKQEELGDRVGKNRTTVNNYIRLLKLPPEIQIALRDNKISMGHARALINVESVETKLAVFRQIVENDLSVRKVEDLVRDLSNDAFTNQKTKKKSNPDARFEIVQLQSKLSSHFGTKIEVKSSDQTKGEIKIPFASQEDLNRILEILNF